MINEDGICDLCEKEKRTILWYTHDDPYIIASICKKCLKKLLKKIGE